jgi:tRNA (guanine-N7-)-methyltransferase
MPHIVVDKIKKLHFPVETNGVEFLFKAENLIGVKTEKSLFLINIRQKENGFLIKYDKITRPLSSEIKKAYNAFVKLNECRVLFENISGIKEKTPNKNLLDITADLNETDIIEVGFGSGRHLIHLAKKYPEKTILGIEIHKPSIEQVLRRCIHENINNIRIINHDARIILSKIKSNRLHSVYVHFPVPWDKKPLRRVINGDFIKESVRTLEKGGFLHLRTDSENYFEYSLKEFLKFKQTDLEIKKNIPYEISSKYEDRWKKMDKNIYDIYMKCNEISAESNDNFNFTFEKKLENLILKPFVYDKFVIHIEKVFKIDENRELIRATIGNFNRPEHIYILNKDKPEYFKAPALIKENFLAHQELKRLFNGTC